MGTTQPRLSSRFDFLKEGLLLPARNRGLFVPILALTVADTAFHAHVYSLMSMHDAQSILLVGATSVLSSVTVGTAIWAITASAAVHTYFGAREQHSFTFCEVVTKVFDGGLKAGPVATAASSNVVNIVYGVGAVALAFLVDLIVTYTRTLLFLDLLVAVLAIVGLLRLYVSAVFSILAVIVSASEPGCHGAAALRRAWRLTAENAEQAVLLVLAEGAVAVAISQWHAHERSEISAREHGMWCPCRVPLFASVRRRAGVLRVRGHGVLLRVQTGSDRGLLHVGGR